MQAMQIMIKQVLEQQEAQKRMLEEQKMTFEQQEDLEELENVFRTIPKQKNIIEDVEEGIITKTMSKFE